MFAWEIKSKLINDGICDEKSAPSVSSINRFVEFILILNRNLFKIRIVRTKAEKCSFNKVEDNNFDVICRSNSSENNQTINDCHSSTNSSDEIHLDNYPQFQTTWNHQDNIYQKDSRKSSFRHFIFSHFFF